MRFPTIYLPTKGKNKEVAHGVADVLVIARRARVLIRTNGGAALLALSAKSSRLAEIGYFISSAVRTPLLSMTSVGGPAEITVDEQSGVLTNPSIGRVGAGAAVAVREVNYQFSNVSGHYQFLDGSTAPHSRTWLFSWPIDATAPRLLQARGTERVSDVGLEDPRLIEWHDQIWILWSVARVQADGSYRNGLALGRVVGDDVVEVHELASPHSRPREKNWAPFVVDGNLFVVYDFSRTEIYRINDDFKLSLHFRHIDRDSRLSRHSGSSQLIQWCGGWLTVTHTANRLPRWLPFLPNAYYPHYFVWLSDDFRTTRVSDPFFFSSRGIEFCAGLMEDEGSLVLSYGSQDARAHILTVSNSSVREQFASHAPPGQS